MTIPQTPFIVFGYGSLIFKPPPHVISKVSGFLKGYVRRFAQKSHDHRGTPENPGRVVTLIHKEDWDRFSAADAFPDEDVVWGVAYTIDPLYVPTVREYLDHRENDGYTLETLDIYNIESGVEKVIVHNAFCYVGRPDNPSFRTWLVVPQNSLPMMVRTQVGSEPIDALAERIWKSVGPSGRNKVGMHNGCPRALFSVAPSLMAPHDRIIYIGWQRA
ncbi:hypothetical protein PAXRUDRAFT_826460 [Paxillus rubicundulus Ve08.2h10]|uniref:glutathione-specific gamma-glutamylcyclotransferase n=1 Tax=Paxillus rubicundulus Ve08.2h10 TaxID=930991 RepID=A0A0D0DZK2_9AGAM|nr:hypothetical protein PAXRUDRAFT_826460 [Paxillus rubicundulus Ve08.2h10]